MSSKLLLSVSTTCFWIVVAMTTPTVAVAQPPPPTVDCAVITESGSIGQLACDSVVEQSNSDQLPYFNVIDACLTPTPGTFCGGSNYAQRGPRVLFDNGPVQPEMSDYKDVRDLINSLPELEDLLDPNEDDTETAVDLLPQIVAGLIGVAGNNTFVCQYTRPSYAVVNREQGNGSYAFGVRDDSMRIYILGDASPSGLGLGGEEYVDLVIDAGIRFIWPFAPIQIRTYHEWSIAGVVTSDKDQTALTEGDSEAIAVQNLGVTINGPLRQAIEVARGRARANTSGVPDSRG